MLYYKMRQKFVKKMHQVFYLKLQQFYYKMQQFLQLTTDFLQNATLLQNATVYQLN